MHMADALLAPAVAATMYVASAGTAGLSMYKINKEERCGIGIERSVGKLPVMAVMSAFVFAGQMVNYTIPGTGASGHICGGMLLTALLGPWAGFLSMLAVLTIQCLFFADGGLMALGANIWNMAFYGCFVGYYLIFRPIMRSHLLKTKGRVASYRFKIITASIIGCIVTLQLGAFSVVLETSLSGITELPFMSFVAIMQPIHLAIGVVEGLITSAVLIFVYENRPELIKDIVPGEAAAKSKHSAKSVLVVLAVAAVVIGGGLSLFASSNPDGLEWSIFGNKEMGYAANMGLDEDNYGVDSDIPEAAGKVQDKTAILPDYAFAKDADNPAGTMVSGIVGSLIVAAFVAIICAIGTISRRKKGVHHLE